MIQSIAGIVHIHCPILEATVQVVRIVMVPSTGPDRSWGLVAVRRGIHDHMWELAYDVMGCQPCSQALLPYALTKKILVHVMKI